MLRLLYITVCLSVLFISCYNKPAIPSSLSSEDDSEIGMLLKKTDNISNTDSGLYWAGRAYNLSAELKDPRWMAKTQLAFSRIYRSKHDDIQGYDSLQKAFVGLEKYGNKEDMGDALIEQLHYYDNSDYLDSSMATQMEMIKRACQLFNQAGASEKYAAALCKMGYITYMNGGDSTNSIMDTLKKALGIYKGGNGSQYVYDAMALQYLKDGSWPQAIDYDLQAITTAEKFNDTSKQVGQMYDRLGSGYYNSKQFSQSLPYSQKAMTFYKKYRDTTDLLEIARSIVTSYYMANEYSKAIEVIEETIKDYNLSNTDALFPFLGLALICYSETGNDKLAKSYHDKLLQYSANFDKLDQSQAFVYTYLISYYLRKNQFREAEKYCIVTDTFMHFYKIPRMISKNYGWWSSADYGLGHYKAAFDHLKKEKEISDTLFSSDSRKQLDEINVKYETEKKERDIELLTKQSTLQQATLKNTKFTKNVMLGAAGMLALMLGLGYNRYRLKQRSNRKLALKQQEINEKNEALERLVKEKEWLVKEMHHRVKNNLQVVMSLLNSQSMYLENISARAAIKESQDRMHTISLIHQKLYQSDNSTMVSMPAYVGELINYLRESLDGDAKIRFEHSIESIELDVAQAIPVGLILNEAITNAIKYAFPGDKKGTITVSMTRNKMQDISLSISDNGVGLKSDNAVHKSGSLGMSLMDGLTNQLGGVITKTNDHGFSIKVVFPDTKEIAIT